MPRLARSAPKNLTRQALTRDHYVLAAISSVDGISLTLIQAQRLFFFLDLKLPRRYFDFRPCAHGPFDSEVEEVLERLAMTRLVRVETRGPLKRYSPTFVGSYQGKSCLSSRDLKTQDYIRRCLEFVSQSSFDQVSAAIYSEAPNMIKSRVFAGEAHA